MKGWQKGLIVLGASIMLLAASITAFLLVLRDQIRPPDLAQPTMVTPPTVVETQTHIDKESGAEVVVQVERPASHKDGFYNILIVGTDNDGTRTDTIMIARLDTNENTAAVMSIPRDTVISGNYTVPKINGVYGGAGKGEKGMNALKQKLAQLLGFEVDGYVLVNLDAFVELVDLVGGVDFDVPMDMHYEDPTQDLYIHLEAGPQHLDGEQAMQLVRFRKGYATQDLQRTKTQQLFMQALAQSCLDGINLKNIGRMSQIVKENLFTDMTLGNIAYFGEQLMQCDFENMFSYTLEGESVMIGDASCYAIYRYKTLEVVNAYFNPYEADITEANVTIRTPDEIRAEEAAKRAEEEALEEDVSEEEMLPEGEIPEEEVPSEEETEELIPDAELPEEDTLPTDQWVEEPIEQPEEEEIFWPGR